MPNLERYLFNNIGVMVFSIFAPLFSIAAIVFLIRLATLTAVVKMSTSEMFYLFILLLPDLIFYTLPVSFFIGTTIALAKLSHDYELTVIFTLGISPWGIIKPL